MVHQYKKGQVNFQTVVKLNLDIAYMQQLIHFEFKPNSVTSGICICDILLPLPDSR